VSRLVAALTGGILLLVVCLTQANNAVAAGCPTEAYIAQLQQADSALRAGAQTQTVVQDVQAAERIDARSSVYLAPILDDLESSPPDAGDARARLDAVAGALALPRGSTCNVDSTPARNQLRNVYASRAFGDLDQGSQPSLLDQIARAIGAWIGNASRTLGLAGGIAVGAAALLIIAALVGWRARASAAGRAATALDEPADQGIDPDVEWSLALAAAARGDFRQAIRRAFRAALLDVMWRGRLHVDAAWTTRELLASAAADADLLALLAPAAAGFDRAWYSGDVVESGDWDVMKARCEALRRLATRRRPEPVA
jgi:hypothetical protein